jgi:spore coat polysaccharide biosynthesis protein SpsF
MSIVCIIEARMGSTRLPGKVMMKVDGIPMIQFLVERIRKVKKIKKVIIATTKNKKDDILVNFCKKKKINFYRGSENNVVKRIFDAAKKFDGKIIVSITGDCPLIDPKLIIKLLDIFIKKKPDIATNSHIRSYPDGMDCTIVNFKSLKKINDNARGKKEREHTFLYVERNISKFKLINDHAAKNNFWPDLGITLDEKKDFLLLKKIIKYFKKKRN